MQMHPYAQGIHGAIIAICIRQLASAATTALHFGLFDGSIFSSKIATEISGYFTEMFHQIATGLGIPKLNKFCRRVLS